MGGGGLFVVKILCECLVLEEVKISNVLGAAVAPRTTGLVLEDNT